MLHLDCFCKKMLRCHFKHLFKKIDESFQKDVEKMSKRCWWKVAVSHTDGTKRGTRHRNRISWHLAAAGGLSHEQSLPHWSTQIEHHGLVTSRYPKQNREKIAKINVTFLPICDTLSTTTGRSTKAADPFQGARRSIVVLQGTVQFHLGQPGSVVDHHDSLRSIA